MCRADLRSLRRRGEPRNKERWVSENAKGLRRATERAYPVAGIQFVDREIDSGLKDTLSTEGLDHLSTAKKVGEDAVLRW